MQGSDGGGTLKTATGGSRTGTSHSAKGPPTLRRRRTRILSEKKIADDEYMAAAIGDVEWLRQSLREIGGNINYDKNGLSALHLAAIHGRLECMKLCIEKFKFDINLPSTTGWRAVHLAISNQTGKRSLTCLKYLLEKGADSSICNDDGISPVHQAASEGHVQCLKLLIERGAQVDGMDCRGNTPLDLAKLWGHRKSARILAAEMWHQDKDHVAKEMTQLKKIKMQQILHEMEEEENMKAAQEFYGERAFQDWLDTKDLVERPAGPEGQRPARVGFYRPNSQTPEKQPSKVKVSLVSKTPSPIGKRRDTFASMFTDEEGTYENTEQLDASTDKIGNSTLDRDLSMTRSRSQSPGYQNPNPWIHSTKVYDKDYVPNLKDEYPRDEYTLMPRSGTAPKFYEGKHLQLLDITELERGRSDLKTKKLRNPDLPREVIDKALAHDPSIYSRPFMFKTKHIFDIHMKKKFEEDDIIRPKSEAPLHLTHDLRSHLIKNSLVIPMSAPSRKKSTPSSWAMDHFPREMVINTMKQMSKPTHFPNVKGREYVLNMGDLQGV